jgi:putative FmdB family regulatory protein
MPTYDYVCDACGHEFEAFESIMSQPQTDCPKCKAPKLRRKIGPGAAILFKGSGFYKTDYRSDSYKSAAKAEKSSSESSSTPKSDSSKSDSSKSDAPKTDSSKSSSTPSSTSSNSSNGAV